MTLEQILSDQENTINKLEHRLKRRKGRASLVLNEIGKLVRNDYNTRVKLVPIATAIAATKQQINPTNGSLNYKSKQKRRDETLGAAVAFMALQMTQSSLGWPRGYTLGQVQGYYSCGKDFQFQKISFKCNQ